MKALETAIPAFALMPEVPGAKPNLHLLIPARHKNSPLSNGKFTIFSNRSRHLEIPDFAKSLLRPARTVYPRAALSTIPEVVHTYTKLLLPRNSSHFIETMVLLEANLLASISLARS